MGHNNIIELNGKRYDAITGAYIGKSHSAPVPAAPKPVLTIDGVRRPSAKPPTHTKRTTTQKPSHTKHENKREHHNTHHKTPSKPSHTHHDRSTHHTKPHRPEHTKTLMRSAVKKPNAAAKASKIATKPRHSMEFKKAAHTVNQARLHRSLHTPKHHDVQRFNEMSSFNATAVATISHTPQPAAAIKPPQSVNYQTPAKQPGATLTVNQVFENAIAHATSHEQPAPKLKPSRFKRVLRASLVTAVLLALIGGFLWMQRPAIELKLASFRAGFQADKPSYQLTGYEHTSTRQNRGQVIISYHSGNRYYEIVQQKSDWNSQTLLDSAVLGSATGEPQTIENRGRIVYLYKNTDAWNASWVDGGLRYDITGNANMTQDDIAAIVDSM